MPSTNRFWEDTREVSPGARIKAMREEKEKQNAGVATDSGVSAYQRNLAQQSTVAASVPNTRQVLGQIWNSDKLQVPQLYSQFKTLQQDKTSPWYNPYTQPTNQAVGNLEKLGVDVSNIDEDWFKRNSYLMNFYNQSSTTNNPTSPGKKATLEQQAAYQYYQVWAAEEKTQKAEQEWEALQQELAYWAWNPSRNYSDEDIINRIDWSKYTTLEEMKEKAKRGTPVELNRAVGFSDDALYGVLWAARNGGGYDDMDTNMAMSALGEGNQWQEKADVRAMLDPGNKDAYSPYAVGSTMDAELAYFGMSGFNQQWIDDHYEEYKNSSDPVAREMFYNVVEAQKYTDTLFEELDAMEADIKYLCSVYDDPEQVMDAILYTYDGKSNPDYKNLFDLDKTLDNPDPKKNPLKKTTQAVPYRKQDIEKYVQEVLDAKKAGDKTREVVNAATGTDTVDENTAVLDEQAVNNQNGMAPTIEAKGTDAEKVAMASGKTSFWDKAVEAIRNAQDAFSNNWKNVQKNMAGNFMSTAEPVYQYEQHQKTLESINTQLAEVQKQLDAFEKPDVPDEVMQGLNALKEEAQWGGPNGMLIRDLYENPDDTDALGTLYEYITGQPAQDDAAIEQAKQWENALIGGDTEEADRQEALEEEYKDLSSKAAEEESYLKQNKSSYDAAKTQQEVLMKGYVIGAMIAGQDVDSGMLQTLGDLYEASMEYTPIPMSADLYYDKAVEDGTMTHEEAVQSAMEASINNANYAARLEEELKNAEDLGIVLSDQQKANVQSQIDAARAASANASYVMLDDLKDFDSIAAKGKEIAENSDNRIVRAIATGNYGGIDWLASFGGVAGASRANREREQIQETINVMSDKEKNRYFYLLGSGDEEGAQRYLETLTDPNSGILVARRSQATEQEMREWAGQNFFTGAAATGLSLVTNVLGGAEAMIYELGQRITGKRVNPYSEHFDMQNATGALRTGAKEQLVNWAGGENSVGGTAASLFYDGFTAFLDSYISAGMTNAAVGATGNLLSGTKVGKLAEKITDWFSDSKVGQWIDDNKIASGVKNFAIKAGGDFAHAIPMGMNAASSAYRDAIVRYGNEDQALQMAYATFLAETLSEAITFGNFRESFAAGSDETKRGFGEFVKLFVGNGLEEALGEGANAWVEEHADRVIMGPLSNYSQNVEKYKAQGIPTVIAEQMAEHEAIREIWTSAATGFISSGFGTPAEYARGAQASRNESITSENVNEAPVESQGIEAENTESITPADVNEAPITNEETTSTDVNGATDTEEITADDVNTPELRRQDEQAIAKMEAFEAKTEANNNQFIQNLNAISSAYGADATGVAESLAAIFNTANPHTGKAAAQQVIAMTGGDTALALDVMQNIMMIAGPDQNVIANAAVVFGSLSSGDTNLALQWIIESTETHEQVTEEDVNALIRNMSTDLLNPKINEEIFAAVKASRIANRTAQLFQNGEAKKAVKDADKVVKAAQARLEKAKTDAATAQADLNAAVTDMLENPSDTSLNAPVQQTKNALDAANERVKEEERNVEQAVKAKSDVEDQELANSRAQATQEVEQEIAQEQVDEEAQAQEQAAQAFQEALQIHPPTKAFTQPITRESVNGPVQITGILYNDDNTTIFTTDKGTISERELTDSPGQDILAMVDSWNTSDNPFTAPAAWLNHGLLATDTETGEVITLIGFAGRQDGMPVVVDQTGKQYDSDHFQMEPDPVTGQPGNKSLFDVFYAIEDTLPEIAREESFDLDTSEALDTLSDEELDEMEGEAHEGIETITEEELDHLFGFDKTPTFADNQMKMPQPVHLTNTYGDEVDITGMTVTVGGDIKLVGSDGGYWNLSEFLTFPDKMKHWIKENAHLLGDDHFDDGITMQADASTIASVELWIDWLDNDATNTSGDVNQADIDQAFEEATVEEYDAINAQNQTTSGNVNQATGQQLKDWQDPKYHGKVEKTKKKLKPKSKAFQKFFAKNDPAALPYVTNDDGTPKVFFRGYGKGMGDTLYTSHESKPVHDSNGNPLYVNFYMDKISTAESYAGTSQLVNLRPIKNWETAKAAMQDIGYDLAEAPNPNGSGQMGYQVMKNGHAAGTAKNHSDTAATWFAENELARFRKTYGGKLNHKGIHAGYVALTKPMIIDCHGGSYASISATVTAPDGTTLTDTMKTRRWAEWAFEHGFESCIFTDVRDNLNGGGEAGTEVVTSKSGMFKSVYNQGTWNANNPDILALKTKNEKKEPTKLEKLMGKPVSEAFKIARAKMAAGESIPYEELMKLPEVQWAEANMKPGESLEYGAYSSLKKSSGSMSEAVKAIEALFTPERVKEQHKVIQEILDEGSAVFDENGKVKYTGEVKQEKRADVMIGLPASGKSSVADYISAKFGSRILDNDDVKSRLSDFNDGLNSSFLHTESRFLHDQAYNQAIANGDNIILPVVGHNYKSVEAQVKLLKAAGYDVHLHMTNLDQTKAVGRALFRMDKKGRYLPLSYLMGVDDSKVSNEKIQATFDQFKQGGLIDDYASWNTDFPEGGRPSVIEYSNEGDIDIFGLRGQASVADGGLSGRGVRGGPVEGKGSNQIKALNVKNQTATQKQSKKVKEQLKSPQKIAQNLVKSLGFGNYMGSNKFGNLPKAVRGFWDAHGKYLAVKAKDLGEYNVTMHEIGHGIADKLGITGTQDMVSNLLAVTPEFANSYTADQLKDEAFAEFMWRYMESEERARTFAGDAFYDDFERRLAKNPEMAEAVAKARSDLQMYNDATTDDRIAASVVYDKSGEAPTLKQRLTEALSLLVDKSSVAEGVNEFIRDVTGNKDIDISKNIRAMSLLTNHSQKQAIKMLKDNLIDSDGTIIGDGLGKRMEAAGFKGTEENLKLLERYALALHSLDPGREGKPVFNDGMTKEQREQFVEDIKNTRPDIRDAEKAWQEFRHDFLQAWMVDTGYWSQEFLDHLEELNPHYVPTFRVGGMLDELAGYGKKNAKRYTLHEAKGSSQDIYSPFYSFVGMVDKITSMVNQNRVAQTFDNLYQEYEGMGAFARLIPGEESNQLIPGSEDLNYRQQQVMDVLNGQITNDLMDQVLDILKSQPGQRPGNPTPNLLTVQRADGTSVQYQFTDPELYKLLAGVEDKSRIKALQAVGKLTRGMSMLTTGSNPLFAARNAVRDYQNSVNYGTWASNYLSGIPKWLNTFYHVWRGDATSDMYEALGGGGWTRIDQNSARNMREIQTEIFGDDKSSFGKTAKWLGKKLWDTVTMARLNEIIEQTSRQAEFRYGKHDLSTAEGRQEAFLAAQDVTVDFSRSGNGELADTLKKLVPFFNASMQGVYRTGRQFTEAERGRALTRFTKTIVNTGLASALASGLILKFGDDEDKEEFLNMLSDGVKANHLILPNPLKGQDGQPPFLRIPLNQDPLAYAVHGAVTNAIWGGTSDETAIELMATADVILDNLNPLGSGTVFQPFMDASRNKTWYGTPIVRNAQQDWTDPTAQYNEDTPEAFRWIGNLLNTSPEVVEYLASQYTGFLGAVGIPALTLDKSGNIGGLDAVLQSIVKKWTVDPTTSTDVTNSFYDMAADLSTIKDVAKKDRPEGLLLRSLSQEQVDQAYEEAAEMLGSKGIVGRTKSLISDTYTQIDRINANDTLSDGEKSRLTTLARREMLKQVQVANEELEAYRKKYITGETLIDRFFGNIMKRVQPGAEVSAQNSEDPTLEGFAEDSTAAKMSKEVYSKTGKSSALPHPDQTFTMKNRLGNDVEMTIPDAEWPKYEEIYNREYERYLTSKGARWATMTDKQKSQTLTNAHSAANKAMKEQYARDNADILTYDTTGRYGRGNIDLNNRPVVYNEDGSISTEQSFSVNIDGKEVLLPTVINGQIVSEDEAIDYYLATGQYLGKFDTVEEAEKYAEELHKRQDWYYHR